MPQILPPAIFLMGPTASGKTDIAVKLARLMPVELISVDSALVYRDMNIGTAKPDAVTLARAPHYLIDILNPTDAYSAAAFRKDALHHMADITQRGNIPLLVGGTMLYFKALREGLSALPQADYRVRAALDAEIAQHGIKHLYHRLSLVDAETAARLKPTDTQRIQRAMEIYRITGQPMSVLIRPRQLSIEPEAGGNPPDFFGKTGHGFTGSTHEILSGSPEALPYRVISIALLPSDRVKLHARIAARFKSMLEIGLLDELRTLREKYSLHPDLPSMRCVGYRQAWRFLEGEINREQLLETGLAATRQLAKRQLTWLRSMPGNIELDCFAPGLVEAVFDEIKKEM